MRARRWVMACTLAGLVVAGCSLLAPSDDELMGGSKHDASAGGDAALGGAGGDATTEASGGTTPSGGSGGNLGGSAGSSSGGSGALDAGPDADAMSDASAEAEADAAAEADATSEGGSVNQVACGNAECNLPSFCCIGFGAPKCQAPNTACNGTRVNCDGPEDCGQNQVCCAHGSYPFFNSTECDAAGTCNSNNRSVVCGGDPTACPAGTTCQASQLHPEYSICN